MPKLSRRKFLVGVFGVLALAFLTRRRSHDFLSKKIKEFEVRQLQLIPSHTEELEEKDLKRLLLLPMCLFDLDDTAEHYKEFFTWRAKHVPGYHKLYTKFSNSLAVEAQKAYGKSFESCSNEQRLSVVSKFIQEKDRRSYQNKLVWLRKLLFNAEEIHFDFYIIRDLFKLFNQKDAWLLLGYSGYAGMPRGLSNYKNLPKALEKSIS